MYQRIMTDSYHDVFMTTSEKKVGELPSKNIDSLIKRYSTYTVWQKVSSKYILNKSSSYQKEINRIG